MSTIYPKGESLRQAVRWIDEQLKQSSEKPLSELVQEAIFQFDLSPVEGDFLIRFFQKPSRQSDANSESGG